MKFGFFIYGLIDPRTGELRYIGQTSTGLKRRLASHLCASSRKQPTPLAAWLRELHDAGLTPEIISIKEIESAEALSDAEEFWIAHHRGLGVDLLNVTAGGIGLKGCRLSEAHRAKIGDAQRGVPKPKHTDEWKQLMRVLMTGRKRSPESIAKTAAAKRGTKHTEEALDRMSASQLERFSDPSAGVRLSRAHGGRPFMDSRGRGFDTINGAARELGIAASQICRVLKGQRPSTLGLTFKYVER